MSDFALRNELYQRLSWNRTVGSLHNLRTCSPSARRAIERQREANLEIIVQIELALRRAHRSESRTCSANKL